MNIKAWNTTGKYPCEQKLFVVIAGIICTQLVEL